MTTVAEARAELLAKTPRSQSIAAERSEILNSGLAANLEMPHPIFIERGEGAYVFDADGNRYLDTSVGFGLHMLGHRHPEIEKAIKDRAELGWMFGIHTTAPTITACGFVIRRVRPMRRRNCPWGTAFPERSANW